LKAIIVSAPATLREQLDSVTGKMTLIRKRCVAPTWLFQG
jgi:hypothetical protein